MTNTVSRHTYIAKIKCAVNLVLYLQLYESYLSLKSLHTVIRVREASRTTDAPICILCLLYSVCVSPKMRSLAFIHCSCSFVNTT